MATDFAKSRTLPPPIPIMVSISSIFISSTAFSILFMEGSGLTSSKNLKLKFIRDDSSLFPWMDIIFLSVIMSTFFDFSFLSISPRLSMISLW